MCFDKVFLRFFWFSIHCNVIRSLSACISVYVCVIVYECVCVCVCEWECVYVCVSECAVAFTIFLSLSLSQRFLFIFPLEKPLPFLLLWAAPLSRSVNPAALLRVSQSKQARSLQTIFNWETSWKGANGTTRTSAIRTTHTHSRTHLHTMHTYTTHTHTHTYTLSLSLKLEFTAMFLPFNISINKQTIHANCWERC